MKTITMATIALLGLTTIYAIPAPHPCESNDLCKYKKAGYYPYQPDDTRYYYCDDLYNNLGCQQCGAPNIYYSKECDACLARMDVQNKNCPPTSPPQTTSGQGQEPDLNCAPDDFCEGKPNATYQDPSNPTRFFSCVNEISTLCQVCPDSLIYAELCGKCLMEDVAYPEQCPKDAEITPPPAELCPASFCEDKANGDYEKGESKQKFYTCTEGTCIVNKCPEGTVFVEACGQKCEVNYTKNSDDCPSDFPVETTIAPSPSCPPNFCDALSDGSYAKDLIKEFNEYFTCSGSVCYVQNCPAGLVYKRAYGWCDHPSH